MRALLTIVQLTLHEAARRRVLVAVSIGAAAFLVLYAVGFHFMAREVGRQVGFAAVRDRMLFGLLTVAGLYATHFLTMMTAVLLPVDTISGEVASGVAQTVASKPVRRSTIVFGKWLAYVLACEAYLLLVVSGVLASARFIGHYTPPGLVNGLPLMMLEPVVFVSLSIAGGARFSTVTNGVLAFGLYGLAFLGNWVEQIGTYAKNHAAQNVGAVASLVMPTEAVWQRAAYFMQPPMMRELGLSPFSPASLASPAMVVYAAIYAAVALALGVRAFSKRAL